MKKYIFILSVLAFVFQNESLSAQIVGGSGFVKTASNPNSITSLRVIDQRYTGSFAYDTVAQKLYQYDRTFAVGARWIATATTPVSVVGAGDITVTNAGSEIGRAHV